jgi:hypothetical protein
LPLGSIHGELFDTLAEYKIDNSSFPAEYFADLQLNILGDRGCYFEFEEQVVINAEAALVDTSTTSVGQVLGDKTVQEIPLNGRHFTDLSLLTPGTMTPPANGFLSAPLRGQGSFGINTAGQREDTTNWLVNAITAV